MTDQSAYVNAYIENIMGMVHDQLNQIIQLKTQIKVTEPLLSQKEALITDLSSKVSSSQHTETEVATLKEKLRIAEDSYHALTNKVSHMDTLMAQIVEMKKTIQEKDRLLVEKDKEIERLANPPVINKKSGAMNTKKKQQPPQTLFIEDKNFVTQESLLLTESVNDF